MNILTFDIEEWFHLLDLDTTRNESDWAKFEVRIYENVDRVLKILEDTNTSATFFVIGSISSEQVLQAVNLVVEMHRNADDAAAVPAYVDNNVSTKVVKLIQSYTGVVNKMVWRKENA